MLVQGIILLIILAEKFIFFRLYHMVAIIKNDIVDKINPHLILDKK